MYCTFGLHELVTIHKSAVCLPACSCTIPCDTAKIAVGGEHWHDSSHTQTIVYHDKNRMMGHSSSSLQFCISCFACTEKVSDEY